MSRSYVMGTGYANVTTINDVATITKLEDVESNITSEITLLSDKVHTNSKKIKYNKSDIRRNYNKTTRLETKVDRLNEENLQEHDTLSKMISDNYDNLHMSIESQNYHDRKRFKLLIGSICGSGLIGLGNLVLQIIEMCIGG